MATLKLSAEVNSWFFFSLSVAWRGVEGVLVIDMSTQWTLSRCIFDIKTHLHVFTFCVLICKNKRLKINLKNPLLWFLFVFYRQCRFSKSLLHLPYRQKICKYTWFTRLDLFCPHDYNVLYLSLIADTLVSDQDWKWVTHGLPRNCNLFIHNNFLHKNSTNKGKGGFPLLTSEEGNFPFLFAPEPLLYLSHLWL